MFSSLSIRPILSSACIIATLVAVPAAHSEEIALGDKVRNITEAVTESARTITNNTEATVGGIAAIVSEESAEKVQNAADKVNAALDKGQAKVDAEVGRGEEKTEKPASDIKETVDTVKAVAAIVTGQESNETPAQEEKAWWQFW